MPPLPLPKTIPFGSRPIVDTTATSVLPKVIPFGSQPLVETQKEPGFVQSVVQDVANPFLRMGLNLRNVGRAVTGKPVIDTADAGYFGEVKRIPGPFDKGASPLEAVGIGAQMASNIPLVKGAGITFSALKNAFKAGKLAPVLKAAAVPLAKEGVATGGLYGGGKALEERKPIGEVAKETAKMAGVGVVAAPVIGIGGPMAVRAAIKPVKSAVKTARSFFTPTEGMIKTEQTQLREAWADTFKQRESTDAKNQFLKSQGKNPEETLSRFGVIPDTEYVNGKTVIRTKTEGGPIDEVSDLIGKRGEAIQGTLDKIAEANPSGRISIDDIEKQAVAQATAESAGVDLNGILGQVKSRVAGMRTKYTDGFVDVGKINRERIATNKGTKAWLKPQAEIDGDAVLGNVFRDIIDNTTGDETVRRVNAEIGELISARTMLNKMDGKNIGGGRFTNVIASSAGAILGTLLSSGGGPLVKALSAAASMFGVKAFLRMAQRGAFGGETSKRILQHLVEDTATLDVLLKNEPRMVQEALKREVLASTRKLKVKSIPSEYTNELPTIPFGPIAKSKFKKDTGLPTAVGAPKVYEGFLSPVPIRPKKKVPVPKGNYAGAVAGFETDEEGKVRFSPEKAAAGLFGVAGLAAAQRKGAFKGAQNLTTKFLEYAKGKTTLSRQEIADFARRPELKKGEADLLMRKLEEFPTYNKDIRDLTFGELGKIGTIDKGTAPVKTKKFTPKSPEIAERRAREIYEEAKRLDKEGKPGNSWARKPYSATGALLEALERAMTEQNQAGTLFTTKVTNDIKIPAQEFADSIRRDLLELKPVKVKEPQYGRTTIEQGLEPEDFIQGKNYEEVVFESPIATNGSSHYPNSKNYFAHARGDEVVEGGKKIWREQEIQSDLLQKGQLERQKATVKIDEKEVTLNDLEGYRRLLRIEKPRGWQRDLEEVNKKIRKVKQGKFIGAEERVIEIAKLDPFTNDRFGERIMRERIKEKAQKGYEKYRLPTGETIGKIEGFERNIWFETSNKGTATIDPLKPENLKVGKLVSTGDDEKWIITDILGDGRFKAVPKNKMEAPAGWEGSRAHNKYIDEVMKNEGGKYDYLRETFDLTGKSNPQYIRYEKWGKFLKNKYGGREVIDPQENKWMEIDLKKEMGRFPVEAFGFLPFLPIRKKENATE